MTYLREATQEQRNFSVRPSGRASAVVRKRGDIRSVLVACGYPAFMGAIARQRGADEAFVLDASAMAQIAWTALCLVVVWLSARKDGSLLPRGTVARLFLAYGVLGIVSTLWSDRPDVTLYRSVEYLAFLLLCERAVRGLEVKNLRRLLVAYGAILVLSLHLVPSRLTLEGIHDSQAPGAVVGLLFGGLPLSGTVWWAAWGVCLASLVLGTSTASFVSGLVGAIAFSLRARPRKAVAAVAAALIVSALGAAFGVKLESVLFYGKTDQNISSASGRIPTWQWVLEEKISQRPLLGWGFGVGETVTRMAEQTYQGVRMTHLHNAMISAAANLGAAGVLVAGLSLGLAMRCAWRYPDMRARPWLFGGIAAMAVNSLSVQSFTTQVSVVWVAQMLLMLGAADTESSRPGAIRRQTPAWAEARPSDAAPRQREVAHGRKVWS